MCYALGNLLISSLKEIVIIGSEEVERITTAFLETVGTQGKNISFVREDPHKLNLLNTMQLGRSRLNMESGELVLFQPGDLPFMFDIEKIWGITKQSEPLTKHLIDVFKRLNLHIRIDSLEGLSGGRDPVYYLNFLDVFKLKAKDDGTVVGEKLGR